MPVYGHRFSSNPSVGAPALPARIREHYLSSSPVIVTRSKKRAEERLTPHYVEIIVGDDIQGRQFVAFANAGIVLVKAVVERGDSGEALVVIADILVFRLRETFLRAVVGDGVEGDEPLRIMRDWRAQQ